MPPRTPFVSRNAPYPKVSMMLLVMALLLLVQSAARAQAPDTSNGLSPSARLTVQQLTLLNSIPATDWKFHAGDVAHGESPDLDDSGWQSVSASSHAPTDAVWYRRWI